MGAGRFVLALFRAVGLFENVFEFSAAMRAFDYRRIACFIVSDPCGAGDTVPTPRAKIVLVICGDDEYTAAARAARLPCWVGAGVVVLLVLLACLRGDVVIVIEECLDSPLAECVFAPRGYLSL